MDQMTGATFEQEHCTSLMCTARVSNNFAGYMELYSG